MTTCRDSNQLKAPNDFRVVLASSLKEIKSKFDLNVSKRFLKSKEKSVTVSVNCFVCEYVS